jgi:hypothetical protein
MGRRHGAEGYKNGRSKSIIAKIKKQRENQKRTLEEMQQEEAYAENERQKQELEKMQQEIAMLRLQQQGLLPTTADPEQQPPPGAAGGDGNNNSGPPPIKGGTEGDTSPQVPSEEDKLQYAGAGNGTGTMV